jgi:transmembrane protein EpsG
MIIYGVIFPLILFFSLKNFNRDNNFFRVLSMGILITFMGLRYGVGVDYFSYEDMFLVGNLSSWVEPGYFYLMKLIHELNGEFYWVTTSVALITIYFFYKGVTNLTPYFVLSIFLFLVSPSGYGFCVNGMRQGISAAIFLFSIKYIIEENFYKYCGILLIASLFHVSALILIPFYFIRLLKFRRNLYLIIIIVSIILNQLNYFKLFLTKILSLTPWSSVYLQFEGLLGVAKSTTGLGFLFTNIIGLLVVLLIPDELVKKRKYSIIFNFYVIFLVLRNVFFSILILYRLVVYFDWLSYIAIPIFLHNRFNLVSQRIVIFLIIILYSILFYKSLINPAYMLEYKLITK